MSQHSLFFDLDGTLTDPKIGITKCVQFAMAQLGEPVPTTDELLWCIGPPLRNNFVQLVGEAKADEGVALYRHRFADVGLYENTPYDGIHDTLKTCADSGAHMFVASSKPHVFVTRILQHFELSEYFDEIFGSELDGTRSDKRELLAHALSCTKVESSQATMIGDRKHDVIGALHNGMSSVGVLYGYGSEQELTRAGAQHLVSWHDELVDAS